MKKKKFKLQKKTIIFRSSLIVRSLHILTESNKIYINQSILISKTNNECHLF